MPDAKDLKGSLLLYYGTADNNVHPTTTHQLILALDRYGKSYDVSVGPVEELRERATATIHLLQTSNDGAALDIAFQRRGVTVSRALDGGLEVAAEIDALDGYVIALGHAGVAVRALERRARSLESLFLELTGRGTVDAVPAYEPDRAAAPVPS